MKLYGIKTCDTCRKALKALSAKGDVEFIDVRMSPLTEAEITSFFELFGDALLNTRSTTWRGLSAQDREVPAVELLMQHPTLMKRPLIEMNGQYYLGWSKANQNALF